MRTKGIVCAMAIVAMAAFLDGCVETNKPAGDVNAPPPANVVNGLLVDLHTANAALQQARAQLELAKKDKGQTIIYQTVGLDPNKVGELVRAVKEAKQESKTIVDTAKENPTAATLAAITVLQNAWLVYRRKKAGQ